MTKELRKSIEARIRAYGVISVTDEMVAVFCLGWERYQDYLSFGDTMAMVLAGCEDPVLVDSEEYYWDVD